MIQTKDRSNSSSYWCRPGTLAVLSLIVGALMVVGCGKTDNNSSGNGGAAGTEKGGSDGEEKSAKKEFNYFRTTAHKSLDPMKQFDTASGSLIANLYDTLLEYHYLKRPYQLSPNLVEEMPKLSEDGLTYTFKLRKGIKFIDDACFKDGKGREMTAACA